MFDFSSNGGMNPGLLGYKLMQQSQNGYGNQNDFGSMLLQMALSGMFNAKTNSVNPGTDLKNPELMPTPQASNSPSLTAQPTIPVQPMVGNDIMSQLKDAAAKAFPNDVVRQQVAMTQAILESGLQDGTPSGLARQNNFFGIKSPGTAGTVNMPTNEYINGQNQRVNATFGANATPADSFMQYRNLMNRPRYSNVMGAQTPQDAFTALQQAGYATDPRYAQLLNQIYQRNVAPLYS